MRLKFVVVPLVTGLLSSFTHAAVCPLPIKPEIPDGKNASGAEMQRAKKAVEVFIADIAKYLECDSSPIKRHRAEERATEIEALFNEQMQLFKEKG
jgi:hypothetical protein